MRRSNMSISTLRSCDQHKPAYLAINPNGKVPTLVKGERITWESDAVICQLSEDMGADLWPHDSRQIEITRWFSWNQQHFSRACGSLYFENIVKSASALARPIQSESSSALGEFRRWANVLDRSSCGPHLAGRQRHHRRRFFGGDGASLCRRGAASARRIPERAPLARSAERNRELARTVSGALVKLATEHSSACPPQEFRRTTLCTGTKKVVVGSMLSCAANTGEPEGPHPRPRLSVCRNEEHKMRMPMTGGIAQVSLFRHHVGHCAGCRQA